MPDRSSYVRAAIAAETTCTAAKLEAARLEALGLSGSARALALIARVEAVKAARMRERAGANLRQALAWRGQRPPQPRQAQAFSG